VVGRSPSVLIDTVEILRGKGYSADATNQFDRVLDMVPTGSKSATGSPAAGSKIPPVSEVNTRSHVG
jgi:hypothetical protein